LNKPRLKKLENNTFNDDEYLEINNENDVKKWQKRKENLKIFSLEKKRL
jgi:hypothetical protein